jgi:uncharacterized membrane protein YfcA
VSPPEIVVITIAVVVGACVQGSVGFGFGLIAAPVAALVDGRFVPGPLLFSGVILAVLVAMRERGALDWLGIRWAVAGRIPGTLLGAWAVAALPERGLVILFASAVLAAVALSLAGWTLQPDPPTLLGAGATSGFMGTVTSIGGPPMALVYQRHTGAQLRATLALFFLIGAAFSLFVLYVAGQFGEEELRLGLLLLPGMLAGFALSRLAARVLDRGYTRVAVLAFASLASVALLVQQLV